ncbi:MAG: hypothetical protein OES10_03825 [Gammaproteobacteria bacterium]|nr:hypothetical protein [Gammaproteobacteria bacterium]
MHRSDTDAGGAADLQTDIMRFMAILALCLVAIFALVQSIPLVPEPATQSQAAAVPPPVSEVTPQTAAKQPPSAAIEESAERLELIRPNVAAMPLPKTESPPVPAAAPSAPAPAKQGFTLRFESDLVLTRLVAAGQVGFYAVGTGRTQRMTVSESRISFWDASAPKAFHEMETMTVPRPVIDALARTGVDTKAIEWGVTLPGRLRQQLDSLLRGHTGGALVIGADGSLRLESS